MLHRLAFPLIYFLAPRLLPVLFRYGRLVWRLTWDKRVPVVLRALVPLAIVYAISPLDLIKDRIPYVGRFDDLVILGLALLFLIKLSPQHVLNEHLGIAPTSNRPEDKDPSKVVDSTSKVIDD